MEPHEMISAIETKEDFADFVGALRTSFASAPSEWENLSIERFLEAMEAWVRAADHYVKNTGDADVVSPSWRTFAKILYAAKIYE